MSQLPEMQYQTPQPKDNSWMAIVSLVLGGISLLAWCIPLCGLPISVVGLIFGFLGLKTRSRTLAIIGIILNGLGLLGTLINAAIGAYLGATGQHPLFKSR